MPETELLSVVEAARRLGCSTWSVRSYINQGRLKAVQPVRSYKVPVSEVERLLKPVEAKR